MIPVSLRALVALPLVAACSGTEPPKLPSHEKAPIFRYIDISPYGGIIVISAEATAYDRNRAGCDMPSHD